MGWGGGGGQEGNGARKGWGQNNKLTRFLRRNMSKLGVGGKGHEGILGSSGVAPSILNLGIRWR